MGVNTKTIKRRIKSVGSTKKITKAMEMISAAKMRKAVANVLATRHYATLAWQMLLDVGKKTNVRLHPLLMKRKIKKIGIILVTSNRGMAGGFSSKLLQETDRYIKELSKKQNNIILSNNKKIASEKSGENAQAEIILLGKRGRKIYNYFGHKVVAEYEKIDLTTKIEEILPLAKATIADYINGVYDQLCVAYTDFVSPIKQVPRVKQLLPLEEKDELLGHAGTETDQKNTGAKTGIEFKFEPKPEKVLSLLIPRLVEMQIYQAILESDASEHSSRMMSMRNASDAAEDIIKELNYTFNKARQSAITQEIAEICGGAAALE